MPRYIDIKIDLDVLPKMIEHSAMVCLAAHGISIEDEHLQELGNNAAATVATTGQLDAEEDRLALWIHLVSEHAGIYSPQMPLSDLIEEHDHEHRGPGTIRNHPYESRKYQLRKVASVLREADYVREEPMSMLSKNNTIELPAAVIKDIKTAPGEYVYFVKSKDGGHRMLNEREMDDALDPYEGSFREAADNEGARIASGSDD